MNIDEQMELERNRRPPHTDEAYATIAKGIILHKDRLHRVSALVISHLDGATNLHTDSGAASFVIYVSPEAHDFIEEVTGHGKVKVVSHAAISGLISGAGAAGSTVHQ